MQSLALGHCPQLDETCRVSNSVTRQNSLRNVGLRYR